MLQISLTVLFTGLAMAQVGSTTQDSADAIAFWNGLVINNSLAEVHTQLGAADNPPWPRIPVEDPMLASMLMESLREFEANLSDTESPLFAVPIYADFAFTLGDAGGYINQVLADTFRRIALVHMSRVLVSSPDAYQVVSEDLRRFRFPVLSAELLLRLAREDAGIPMNKLGDLSLERIGAEIGKLSDVDVITQITESRGRVQYTSHLISQFDLPVLLWRLFGTDTFATLSLPGLVRYLELGGQLQDLRIDDVRPFEAVMGEAVDEFSYEPAGLRGIHLGHVLGVVKLFGSGWKDSTHYKTAMR